MGHCVNSSRSFSTTLSVGVNTSRLERAVLAGFTIFPPVMLCLLPAAWYWILAGAAAHLLVAAVEGCRCGVLMPHRRVTWLGVQGWRWRVVSRGGRSWEGPLRRSWCNPWCVYIEVGETAFSSRALLLWRDAVSQERFRDLCAHIKVGYVNQ